MYKKSVKRLNVFLKSEDFTFARQSGIITPHAGFYSATAELKFFLLQIETLGVT